jgi:very-short-patch-repair endonuclease
MRRARPGGTVDAMEEHEVSDTAVVPVSRLREVRRRRAEQRARDQSGILSRRQLYAMGLTRSEVRANVRALRWRTVGRQCVCVHRGPLPPAARHWVAVLEAGPRAYVDAASALVQAGLRNFVVDRVRISVPRGARVYRRLPGVDIRQTRRWRADDVAPGGLPRARPAVAAVRAALWARSDREAALVLTMTVQQGLATAESIALEMLKVKRDRRRAFIHQVLHDLLDGVRSLGELDVARACRERGLPEPSRQALRRANNGSYYLDVYWERWHLVVEIDGIHHTWATQVVGDAIRQNTLALQGDTVLRLPLLGLRVAPDEFFAQIEQALVDAGCDIPGRRTA